MCSLVTSSALTLYAALMAMRHFQHSIVRPLVQACKDAIKGTTFDCPCQTKFVH